MKYIPYGKQFIDETDINAVINVLKSDYLTQGPVVEGFERAICEYTGANYAVAVSSGTAALHISVAALDLELGAEGITSPNTFVASANCLIYNGLVPVFADIDDKTYIIDPEQIKDRISNKTKVAIPVHFAGQTADMVNISKILQKHNIHIIEDACHAIGSKYVCGANVGSCKYSDMTVFSFHPVKTITTGEGGVVTTNSKVLYEKLRMLRSHGIIKEGIHKSPGPWYYEMRDLGYNYRMTDIQSSLGCSQMGKLDDFIERRNIIVDYYNSSLSNVDWLVTPWQPKDLLSSYHLYVLKIDFSGINKTRAQVMEELREKKIGTQVHYIPVHTQPYYVDNYGYSGGDYPNAEEYYRHALSIPLFPQMTDREAEHVVQSIRELNR